MFDETTSVETLEVAEPVETNEDLGEEETEIADQSSDEGTSNKTSQDSAFAELRRRAEEAERRAEQFENEIADLRFVQEARANAIQQLTGEENAEYSAIAESLGIDVEDVMATISSAEANATLKAENERLKEQVSNIDRERRLDTALATLNKLDPNLTNDEIVKMLGYDGVNGLTVEDGYYAVKARSIMNSQTPPKEIGKLNNSEPVDKDFISKAECDAMTPEQQRANYKLIIASMPKWK